MANEKKNNHKRKSKPQGITAITVCGYKSICKESTIEIRPLTILAGANSSGKSSIMQPLLMLKQTLEASYDPGALLLDGPNVRFTSADQLLARTAKNKCVEGFSIGISIDADKKLTLKFTNKPEIVFDLTEMDYRADVNPLTLRPDLSNEEIDQIVPSFLIETKKRIAENFKQNIEWQVQREFCFLGLSLVGVKRGKNSIIMKAPSPSSLFERCIREMIHVPGLRGNPERNYKLTSSGPTFPGTFKDYVASIIYQWKTSRKELVNKLSNSLDQLGLTCKVEARKLEDTQIEIQVGRLPHITKQGRPDMVSIADVGFGVSQSLPVLVSLLAADKGQLIYIEQPEIHLHPRAQVALAGLLADAAKRGVKVVAETHSSLLLLAVQTLVAKGDISPDLVKLHWFERDPEGITKITSRDLDKDGSFGDWPEDFGDVELETERQFLNSVKSVAK